MPSSTASASDHDGLLDSVDESIRLNRIGFGSCNNQNKGPQKDVWEALSKRNFDLWVWGGDVVYAKRGDLGALQQAYKELQQNGSYFEFARTVGRVVGTWDDHDLGVNDGGETTPNLEDRKHLFLDFLGVPADAPRRKRKGVYSAHEFGRDDDRVRVILLDTRYGRSNYLLSEIGSFGEGTLLGKLSPKLAAGIRTGAALTGLTRSLSERGISNQRMLDEEQWNWLEKQLSVSTAAVNIVVSSVQVLTRNPSVESWGHFPHERQRLLNLIQRTKPSGFILLSGDVHIAIASSPKPDFPVFELTSSGLTHTCTAGSVPYFVCALVWNIFEQVDRKQTMILSRNFGELNIDWQNKRFVGSLNSLTDNLTASFVRSFDVLPDYNTSEVPGITPAHPELFLGLLALGATLALLLAFRVLRRLCSK